MTPVNGFYIAVSVDELFSAVLDNRRVVIDPVAYDRCAEDADRDVMRARIGDEWRQSCGNLRGCRFREHHLKDEHKRAHPNEARPSIDDFKDIGQQYGLIGTI